MSVRPAAPFQAQAFELVATGPVALRLTDQGVDELVVVLEATPSDPARILVDGSIVETFHRGTSHTTRAYPTISSSWVVEGGAISAYRLGDRGADFAAASDLPRNFGAQLHS
jgi:beta-fructofuranosidase